jgi:hypothetical protein
MLYLVSLVLVMLLPIAFLVPVPYTDDGGYARILQYFLKTGKIDLMHWSQPTIVGLVLLSAPIVSVMGATFKQLDTIGIFYTICALSATYLFARSYLETLASAAITLSLFCFSEIPFAAASFMTDMPYLAYFAWWLLFTQRILSTNSGKSLKPYIGWCLTLVLAMLTRSTIALMLPGFILAAVLCVQQRKQLVRMFGLFLCCGAASTAVTHCMVINPVSLMDSTALQEIFGLHDWRRFNLRIASFSIVSLLFACAPLLACMRANAPLLRRLQFCLSAVALLVSAYLLAKGFVTPPIVTGCIVAAFYLPSTMAKAKEVNLPLWTILFVGTMTHITVMPIMAHPVPRHAIPIMLMLVLMLSMVNCWHANRIKFCFPLAAALIFYNVIALYQVHLVQFATWQMANKLVSLGNSPESIDAGWSWFCYHGLHPGTDEKTSYEDRFNSWQKNATFIVSNENGDRQGYKTIAQIPVNYLWKQDLVHVMTRNNMSP